MSSRIPCRFSFSLFLGLVLTASALAEEGIRIQLHTDFSEADAALAILDKRNSSRPVTDSDCSFVFDMDTDPAIFLYIDPSESPASFENTVAHEMHHIGLSSIDKAYEERIASLPPAARVARLMGAFGEGEAMLAAAGGPNVDPVATASEELKDN